MYPDEGAMLDVENVRLIYY